MSATQPKPNASDRNMMLMQELVKEALLLLCNPAGMSFW